MYCLLLDSARSDKVSICANAQSDTVNFLRVGDKAPLFLTTSYSNSRIDLTEMLKKGKVVVVFYRGAWCSYCNKHMSHLQDSLRYYEEIWRSI